MLRPQRTLLAAFLLAIAASACALEPTLSFRINERAFALPETTPIEVDGAPRSLADLRYVPDGMQVRWQEGAAGKGEAIAAPPALVFSYSVIGPVTATTPLSVLGQPLTVNADTVLAGVPDPAAIPVGTAMAVAGLLDANGSLLATLVERRAAAGNRYLLTGSVQQLGAEAGTFRVGALWVSAPSIVFADCVGGAPAPGDFVEIRADASPPLAPGGTLTTVTGGRCITPVPAGTAGAVGFLQGLITAVPAADRFEIGALTIAVTPATKYSLGTVDDLAPGVAVTVDGTYADARTFVADVVQFLGPVVRFRVPMQPADVTPGVALRPLGVTVRSSAQARDVDGILAAGLAQPRQVEVRGYLDRLGRAYATRVRDRGAPNFADARLRGPVEAIAAPTLSIQGQTVDTTGSTFTDELGAPLTAQEFFAAVRVDDLVDVGGASYDAASHTFTGGPIVLIGRDPVVVNPPPVPAPATWRAGTAAGYALPDVILSDGFE